MPPSATQVQIDALGARMDKNFDELKGMIGVFDVRLRGSEMEQARTQPIMDSKINAAWSKVDKHEADLIALQKTVTDLAYVIYRMESIAKWMLGILTALIVALLVAVATGKVALVFSN